MGTPRHVDSVTYQTMYTTLPILPQDTAPAQAGDIYPSARAIRRCRRAVADTDLTSISETWAQLNVGNPAFLYLNDANSASAGIFHSGRLNNQPFSMVNWAGMTRTGQRPRNPAGGIRRYVTDIGLATLSNGATTLATQELYEDRQPILVPPNTFVEARKLAPDGSATSFFQCDVIGFVVDPSFRAHRWFGGSATAVGNGGSISVVIYANGTGATISFYAVPIDPVTLQADISSAILLKDVIEIGGGPTSATISHDDIEDANVIPFDQYWIYCEANMLPDPDWFAFYQTNLPDNIPPPYDCSGFDGAYAPGGIYV